MIGIGLAGLGVHGSRYARHLLNGDVPGARLVAVSRRDAEAGRRFADEHGLAFVEQPEGLATHPDVDAVVIVLRPDLHAAALEACLAAGKPVLAEKPMTTDAASARTIASRVEETGLPFMVAHTLRFNAVVEAIRREIEPLGQIRMISIGQHFETGARDWIDAPGTGGALINTAIHGLDLLRYLAGAEPVSITAESARTLTCRTEDQVSVLVRLEPGGILGVVSNSRTTEGRTGRIEVVADRGVLVGDHVHNTLHRLVGRTRERVEPIHATHTIEVVLRAFVESLVEGSPPPVTARDGRIAVEMVDAARRSAEEGRRVEMPVSG